MAVQQYTAARALQRDSCTGKFIQVATSILPGCGQAVPLSRALLRAEVGAVEAAGRAGGVELTTYVDDIGQSTSGTVQQVLAHLAEAGLGVVAALHKLRLKVASKSVVVASSPSLAASLRKLMSEAGVLVAAAVQARDLGIAYGAGKQRLRSMTVLRCKAAGVKLGKLARLSKVHRAARKVAVAAALPQALWGVAAEAMSTARVQKLRTQLVASSGAAKGRCRTMAILANFGIKNDPAVKAPCKVVQSWLQLLRLNP